MTHEEGMLMTSPVEKADENRASELVEHLSSTRERSTNKPDDQIEAKKLKVRERNLRKIAILNKKLAERKNNLKKERELLRNPSSLNDGFSPSTGMLENSSKINSLEPSAQAPVSAHTEELTGDVVIPPNAAPIKGLEGHTQVDSNSRAESSMTQEEAMLMISPVEKVNENRAPELVEHLSSARECSTNKLDDPIEAKKLKNRKRNLQNAARQKRKRSEKKNLSSLSDGVSPSTLGMQENSANNYGLEPSAQAPVSAYTEELTGEVVIPTNASPIKGLEGHTQVDSNFRAESSMTQEEAMLMNSLVEKVDENRAPELVEHLRSARECSTNKLDDQIEAKKLKRLKYNLRRRAQQKRKRFEIKNLSSFSDGVSPSTLGMQENFAKNYSLEPSAQASVSAHTEKLTGEVVMPPNAAPVKGLEGHTQVDSNKMEIENEILGKSIEECAEQLNKGKLDTECGTLKKKKRVRKKRKLSSDPSSFNGGSLMDIQGTSAKDSPALGYVTFKIEHMPQDATTISSEISEGTDDDDDVSQPEIGNKGNLAESPGVHPVQLKKKLLVLDVNGILTDIVAHVSEEYIPDTTISRKAAFKRPFCDDFLRFCFDKFHVGVWSSRTMRNVKSALDFLMGDLQDKLLFCWDQTQCTDTGFNTLENRDKPMLLKELKKLWEKHEPSLPWERGDYNESNTLLLDDSPYKALQNPPYTAIFPNPYCYKDVKDNSLGPEGDLRAYLEGLASADDVQKYVEANPFGQQPITSANASWNFYCKVIRDTSLHTKRSYA